MTDREQYGPGPTSVARFRRFWSGYADALERHLDRMDQDRMDQLTPRKKEDKERRRGPNRENHKGETK
jgi:hypothetical protein